MTRMMNFFMLYGVREGKIYKKLKYRMGIKTYT